MKQGYMICSSHALKKKFDHFNVAFSFSIHAFYIYSYIILWSSFWRFNWRANCWRSLVFFQNQKETIWRIDYTLGLKLVLISMSTWCIIKWLFTTNMKTPLLHEDMRHIQFGGVVLDILCAYWFLLIHSFQKCRNLCTDILQLVKHIFNETWIGNA